MAEAVFEKAGRGYNREQVDAFLVELNRNLAEKEEASKATIRSLEQELASLRAQLAECQAAYQALQASSEEALRAKEQECAAMHACIGQRMIAADERAEEIVSDAQKQAEYLLSDAHRRATEEMERLIAETKQRCTVIGEAAELFSGRMQQVSASLKETEALLLAAAEDSKRKALEQTV